MSANTTSDKNATSVSSGGCFVSSRIGDRDLLWAHSDNGYHTWFDIRRYGYNSRWVHHSESFLASREAKHAFLGVRVLVFYSVGPQIGISKRGWMLN